jgi:pimeloyl-ACP methyl ester carboxylesterase
MWSLSMFAESADLLVSPWRFQAHVEVWLLVAFLIGARVYAMRVIGPHADHLRRGEPVVTRRQNWLFAAAIAVLWISSDWPIHDIAEEYLYSVHMFQHMALSYFLPPLALLATPAWYLHDRFKDTQSFFETRMAEFPGLEIELGRLNAVMSHDLRHRLNEIRVPTFVIGARDDQLTPSTMSEELAQRIDGARMGLLREGGHFCPQTVTAEYNAAVLDFLREQRAPEV